MFGQIFSNTTLLTFDYTSEISITSLGVIHIVNLI